MKQGAGAVAAGFTINAVLAVAAVLACAVALAFRPEVADTPEFWLYGTIPLAAAAALAGFQLAKAGRLRELLKPRAGDVTLGFAMGALLLLVSWGGRSLLASPDSQRFAWLLHVYLLFGNPELIQQSALMTALVLGVVAAEELVFRGWMQERLSARLGSRRGWIATALVYAAVASPTLYTLRVPGLGPNPLLFLSALICGLVFSFARHLSGRLPAVVIAHGFFTYYSVVQFRLPGL